MLLFYKQRYYYTLHGTLMFSNFRKTRYVKSWIFFLYWASAIKALNTFYSLKKVTLLLHLQFKRYVLQLANFKSTLSTFVFIKANNFSLLKTPSSRCLILVYYIITLRNQVALCKTKSTLTYNLNRYVNLNKYLNKLYTVLLKLLAIWNITYFYRFIAYYMLSSYNFKFKYLIFVSFLKRMLLKQPDSKSLYKRFTDKYYLNVSNNKSHRYTTSVAFKFCNKVHLFLRYVYNTYTDVFILYFSKISTFLKLWTTKFFYSTINLLIANRLYLMYDYYKKNSLVAYFWIIVFFEELVRYNTYKTSSFLLQAFYKKLSHFKKKKRNVSKHKYHQSYFLVAASYFITPKAFNSRTGWRYKKPYMQRANYLLDYEIEFLCTTAYGFSKKACKRIFSRFKSTYKMSTFLDFFLLLDRTFLCFFAYWFGLAYTEVYALLSSSKLQINKLQYNTVLIPLGILDSYTFIYYNDIVNISKQSIFFDTYASHFLFKKWFFFFFTLSLPNTKKSIHFLNSFFSKNIKNIFYDILFDYLKLYATKTNILPISTLIHSFNYRRISIPLYKIFCNGIFKKRKVQRYRYSYLYSYLEICIAVYRHTSRNFYINTSNVYEIEIIVAFAVHLKIVISKIHTLLYYCVMYNKLLLIANTKNSTINNVNIIFINSTIYYFYNLNIKYFSLSKPYFLFLYTTRFIDFFHSFSNFNSDIFYDYETNKNLLWTFYTVSFDLQQTKKVYSSVYDLFTSSVHYFSYVKDHEDSSENTRPPATDIHTFVDTNFNYLICTRVTTYYIYNFYITMEMLNLFTNKFFKNKFTLLKTVLRRFDFLHEIDKEFSARTTNILNNTSEALLFNYKKAYLLMFYASFKNNIYINSFIYFFKNTFFIYKFPSTPYFIKFSYWVNIVNISKIFNNSIERYFKN